MPFFYKPKVGLHHPLDRAAMSIFGTNRPLNLEKTIEEHSLKIDIKYGENKIFLKRQKTFSSFFRTAGGDLISTEN